MRQQQQQQQRQRHRSSSSSSSSCVVGCCLLCLFALNAPLGYYFGRWHQAAPISLVRSIMRITSIWLWCTQHTLSAHTIRTRTVCQCWPALYYPVQHCILHADC
jgi:hypothetical protein